jgi:hypothetical protein
MKIRLACLVAALLAVVSARPVAAADVSCAEWLAYRKGDASLQGPPSTQAQPVECHEAVRRVCSGAVCHVETEQECFPAPDQTIFDGNYRRCQSRP